MIYYGREYKEENKRQKRTRQQTEAPTVVVRSAMKQPEEKNAQRNPGEKGWTCYYCGKEGHLKRDCPQASKLSPAPGPVCKGPYWKRDCPPRCRPQGSDSQDSLDWRCPGFPTQAPILITPEEPWVLITVGEVNQSISFGHWGNILCAHWSPWPAFLLIHYCNGTIWWAKHYVSHPLSGNWDSCAVYSRVSNHARVSLTPSGDG